MQEAAWQGRGIARAGSPDDASSYSAREGHHSTIDAPRVGKRQRPPASQPRIVLALSRIPQMMRDELEGPGAGHGGGTRVAAAAPFEAGQIQGERPQAALAHTLARDA
jgi:hypothetical protein